MHRNYIYGKNVMDHFINPRNVGEIEDADAIAQVGEPTCGDTLRIYLKVENDIITNASFKAYGCGAAIATSSVATELIKGRKIEEAMKITKKHILDALGGLPASKEKCTMMAEQAIYRAIADYKSKNSIKSITSQSVNFSAIFSGQQESAQVCEIGKACMCDYSKGTCNISDTQDNSDNEYDLLKIDIKALEEQVVEKYKK